MDRDDTTGPIVQIRRRVKAGAEQIFDLWTKPDLMVRWMSPFPGAVDCKASCDLRPGGGFSLVMLSKESSREVSGTYVQIDRPRKFVFTWIGPLTDQVTTLVTVELIAHGYPLDVVVRLTVGHRSTLVRVDLGAEQVHEVNGVESGWDGKGRLVEGRPEQVVHYPGGKGREEDGYEGKPDAAEQLGGHRPRSTWIACQQIVYCK